MAVTQLDDGTPDGSGRVRKPRAERFSQTLGIGLVCALVAFIPAFATFAFLGDVCGGRRMYCVLPAADIWPRLLIPALIVFLLAFLVLLPPTRKAARPGEARPVGGVPLSRFWRGVLLYLFLPGLAVTLALPVCEARIVRLPLRGEMSLVNKAANELNHVGGFAYITGSQNETSYLLLDSRATDKIHVELDETGFRLVIEKAPARAN